MYQPQCVGGLLKAAFHAEAEMVLPDSFVLLLARLEDCGEGHTRLSDRSFKQQLESVLPGLRRYALSLTRDPQQVDDLVQETLLRAWAARDRFHAGTSIRAWTSTILRNLHFTELRRGRIKVDWDDAMAMSLTTPPNQEHRIHLNDVGCALGHINPHFVRTLMIVGLCGLSYDEVAVETGIALGTVKSRVARARTALGRLLEDGTQGEGNDTLH